MKVMIAYPPHKDRTGISLRKQNRYFQYFDRQIYAFPVVMASAATLLAKNGFDVIWSAGIAEDLTYEQWLDVVESEKPDVIVIETKTPVAKRHWGVVDDLKSSKSAVGSPQSASQFASRDSGPRTQDNRTTNFEKPIIVLMGDHVTALPEESMQNSRADFVVTGGDYDVQLLQLCRAIEPAVSSRQSAEADVPVPDYGLRPMDSGLPSGIWYRQDGAIKNTGSFDLKFDLDELPIIDRALSKWHLYAFRSGNYNRIPGTHIMAARDCWWNQCAFCSRTSMYPKYRARTPENVLDEIGELFRLYGVREINDDSGTFPKGEWLEEFCIGMIERGYHDKVNFNCNLRTGVLTQKQYHLMRQAGFRTVRYNLSSADQKVLDRVNKGTGVDDIIKDCRMATEAGLEPHVTTMIGYPWETFDSARRTIDLAKDMFNKSWINNLQASLVVPYPSTPLFKECRDNGTLLTDDWDAYDTRQTVIKCQLTNDEILSLTKRLYCSFIRPAYIFHKLAGLRSWNDVAYLMQQSLYVMRQVREYSGR